MGEFLFYLVIKPIWFLFEIIFRFSYQLFTNPGISILFVSLVMNILVLPMYLRSDAMQAEERKKQKEMEHWVKEIRRVFKGDERFMILSEYYRQNDYQPYYVLKSSLSLLLQVPFFIAAYDFLSNLTLLKGASFWIIKDLGSPDGLIPFFGLHLNLLPILMTAINLTSAAIYTKGGTKKEKIQTVAFALVFLVLLYRSPAGLVFYWTLNNVFSLCKNIVIGFCDTRTVPLSHSNGKVDTRTVPLSTFSPSKLWALSAVLLAVFTGLSIPLSVIEASPMDFATNLMYPDPVRYALLSFATATGVFVIWGAVIFFLSGPRLKKILSVVTFCMACVFIIDHMMFSGRFGVISYNLIYDAQISYDYLEKIFNILFIVVLVTVLVLFCRTGKKSVFSLVSILIACEMIFSICNIVSIEKTVRSSYLFEGPGSSENRKKSGLVSKAGGVEKADINNRILKLSSKGKNVVIIMLDKSIGGYVPYIFNEKPELMESFSGFTYYPNTVSTGVQTLNGSAALFGGYEYALAESDKNRPEVLLKDKQNEALKLMPMIFSREGYHSTVCDMPYINLTFDSVDENYIFDDIENCDAYCTMNGEYNDYLTETEKTCIELEQQKRNFFFYSLFRSLPLYTQEGLYDEGNYLSLTTNSIKSRFITSMAFLRLMPELTEICDDSAGELIVLDNDAAHEDTLLNPPDYEPDPSVRLVEAKKRILPDGREMGFDNLIQEGHYDADMAAFIKLGDWFRYLRDIGVYDNTRIILVADHGFALNQFSYMLFDDLPLDIENVNPVLMVKDFDSKNSGVITDESFMTNADVPTIAMKDIIEKPVNPFTGNPVNSDRKTVGPVVIAGSAIDIDAENDRVYDRDTVSWYSVHDNIFDPKNWEIVKRAVHED